MEQYASDLHFPFHVVSAVKLSVTNSPVILLVYREVKLKNTDKWKYDNWNTEDAHLWNGQSWIPFSFS